MKSIFVNFIFRPSKLIKFDLESTVISLNMNKEFEIISDNKEYFVELRSKDQKVKLIFYFDGTINYSVNLHENQLEASKLDAIFKPAVSLIKKVPKLEYNENFFVYIKENNRDKSNLKESVLKKFAKKIFQNPIVDVNNSQPDTDYLSFSIKNLQLSNILSKSSPSKKIS